MPPIGSKPSGGSSPLARGGLDDPSADLHRRRLIPAGAGRTDQMLMDPTWGPAHPRWRGEDPQRASRMVSDYGSSPLARGGQFAPVAFRDVGGLIPAGAGRTGARHDRAAGRRAHPRWRGEDRRFHSWLVPCQGSSPLARGGPGGSQLRHDGLGLIPAGAGRTTSMRPVWLPRRAHPRWRGEDQHVQRPGRTRVGSSPLARGGPLTATFTMTH